jgi:hypothetical protein
VEGECVYSFSTFMKPVIKIAIFQDKYRQDSTTYSSRLPRDKSVPVDDAFNIATWSKSKELFSLYTWTTNAD